MIARECSRRNVGPKQMETAKMWHLEFIAVVNDVVSHEGFHSIDWQLEKFRTFVVKWVQSSSEKTTSYCFVGQRGHVTNANKLRTTARKQEIVSRIFYQPDRERESIGDCRDNSHLRIWKKLHRRNWSLGRYCTAPTPFHSWTACSRIGDTRAILTPERDLPIISK